MALIEHHQAPEVLESKPGVVQQRYDQARVCIPDHHEP